jgi:hypothetical protein
MLSVFISQPTMDGCPMRHDFIAANRSQAFSFRHALTDYVG